MTKYFGVRGSMETVPEVEVNFDIVRLRTNIHRVPAVMDENDPERVVTPEQWEYDEVVMSNTEYAQHVRELLTADNLNSMEAVAMLYEEGLSAQEQSLSTMEALTEMFEMLLEMQTQLETAMGGAE